MAPQLQALREKARWVRRETLRIHGLAPETRIASSLSMVEILVVLYYGQLLSLQRGDPDRDRIIISKGHGAIALYPILADLGYFGRDELKRVGQEGSFLGGIPDPIVPGFETVNGSLGHGLGVSCGMALSLKRRGSPARVLVVTGDGELDEGSNWEALAFAAHHRLANLTLIVDRNKACMLGFCKDILDLQPLDDKLAAFGWSAETTDGHDIGLLHSRLAAALRSGRQGPAVIIAETVKGKGVERLERDPMSHVRSLTAAEVDELLGTEEPRS